MTKQMEAIIEEIEKQVKRQAKRIEQLYYWTLLMVMLIGFPIIVVGMYRIVKAQAEIVAYRIIAAEETNDWYQARIMRMEKVIEELQKNKLRGEASFYDYDLAGYPGYSTYSLTAASRDIPRKKQAQVCVVDTDNCVVVRINDHGPQLCPEEEPDCYLKDRIIDLSSAAFKKLAPLSQGIIQVEVYQLN